MNSSVRRRGIPRPLLLAALPAALLFLVFVVPNAFLVTASVLRSEDQMMTSQLTLDNYATLFRRALYLRAIWRTLLVGASTGALVVAIAYPLAYYLARTTSRWRDLLVALSLTPLLASVVVRTYGWWVVLNREGAVNAGLRAAGIIDAPLDLMPSTGAIILGLTHALLPYGVLTLLTALTTVNPHLEAAAMSLGANRRRTFLRVTLPLSAGGIAGAFLLAFTLSISAFATPSILGGAAYPVVATQIYNLMLTVLDWSLGSAMSVLLVASAVLLTVLGTALGTRKAAL